MLTDSEYTALSDLPPLDGRAGTVHPVPDPSEEEALHALGLPYRLRPACSVGTVCAVVETTTPVCEWASRFFALQRRRPRLRGWGGVYKDTQPPRADPVLPLLRQRACVGWSQPSLPQGLSGSTHGVRLGLYSPRVPPFVIWVVGKSRDCGQGSIKAAPPASHLLVTLRPSGQHPLEASWSQKPFSVKSTGAILWSLLQTLPQLPAAPRISLNSVGCPPAFFQPNTTSGALSPHPTPALLPTPPLPPLLPSPSSRPGPRLLLS